MDFEDMLMMLVRLLDDEPAAADLVHGRFHTFTVDEYLGA
jgi:superfamily I DNA/RNA helicase